MRVQPEADRQRALRVEVDEQHLAAELRQRRTQVDRGRGLADAALLVAHRDHPRAAVLGQRRRLGHHRHRPAGRAELRLGRRGGVAGGRALERQGVSHGAAHLREGGRGRGADQRRHLAGGTGGMSALRERSSERATCAHPTLLNDLSTQRLVVDSRVTLGPGSDSNNPSPETPSPPGNLLMNCAIGPAWVHRQGPACALTCGGRVSPSDGVSEDHRRTPGASRSTS